MTLTKSVINHLFCYVYIADSKRPVREEHTAEFTEDGKAATWRWTPEADQQRFIGYIITIIEYVKEKITGRGEEARVLTVIIPF